MLKQALAHHQAGHIDQAELAYKEILRLLPKPRLRYSHQTDYESDRHKP